MCRTLLIYPLGNSDFAFNGEETFPRESFRDFRNHLATLKSLLGDPKAVVSVKPLQSGQAPFPSGLDFAGLPSDRRRTRRGQQEFVIQTVRFPILFDLLQELGCSTRELHLQPIASDQRPPHSQDTVDAIPLLRVYLEKLRRSARRMIVHLREPWILKVNVSNYDALLKPYEEFYERVQGELAEFEDVYFSLVTGTPAMSTVAGLIFGPDPRVTFLYKPRGTPSLIYIRTFRERARRETLTQLKHLLERFEFAGALEVVSSPRNGFTSTEVREAKAVLQALAAWQNYDFRQAAQSLEELSFHERVHDHGPIPYFHAFCRQLAREDPAPDERARFWRAKILDTVMRMEIAVYRRDFPAMLHQFYNYNDVCLAWGLNAHLPQLDVMDPEPDSSVKAIWEEFQRRCPNVTKELRSERGKFQLLFALAENNAHRLQEAFTRWLRTHEPLRWFQDRFVDDRRHRLVHGSVQLQEELFDRLFEESSREWDSPLTIRRGDGPWLLLGLVYTSMQALPPDPSTQGFSADLVREVAAQAWQQLVDLCSFMEPPEEPGWIDWKSFTDRFQGGVRPFYLELQRAFNQDIQRKQHALDQACEGWKQELAQEIRKHLSRNSKLRRQMLKALNSFSPPPWGPYMAQRFLRDDLLEHAHRVKQAMVSHLLEAIPQGKWATQPNPNLKSLIGNFVSGTLDFRQLLEKAGVLSPPSEDKATPSRRNRA